MVILHILDTLWLDTNEVARFAQNYIVIESANLGFIE